jgi:putative transposase
MPPAPPPRPDPPDPHATPAPDLVGRLFDPDTPDRTWFADSSYLPTEQAGRIWPRSWTAAPRRMVGWAMAGGDLL